MEEDDIKKLHIISKFLLMPFYEKQDNYHNSYFMEWQFKDLIFLVIFGIKLLVGF